MRLSSDTKSRKSGSYLLSTEQHQTMFWWHHRPLFYLSFDLGKCSWLQRKIVQYFLNWVVLLFNRANCVSLTLSHWWCFRNLYFFIMFRYNRGIWTDIKKKKHLNVFCPYGFWALLTLFFHEKRRGHLRPAVCSWEGETNCLNVSSCETIRLQGCCQGCFWHLAKSLRAILFPWESWIVID